MLKYSQLNWAEQVLSNNCFHHTQDIIILNCSRDYIKDTKLPLYTSHVPLTLGKPNARMDVSTAKLKKKLFTYKKHQRKKNVNIHKNLLFLVDKIQTSPPLLPMPKKLSASSTSNETSHQIKIVENTTDQSYDITKQRSTMKVQTVSQHQMWPSLYDDLPSSKYDQDCIALSDLQIMCLVLLSNIIKTDRIRWQSTIYPSVEPEIPSAVYEFVSKAIERAGYEFGPGSFLLAPTLHKSHYTIDMKDANHTVTTTNEYLSENNEITRHIKKSHKKTLSGTSLLKWVKKKEDKKFSNDSDTSINTLNTVNAVSPVESKKSKTKTMRKKDVKSVPFDVYCEEQVVNKIKLEADLKIQVQYLERSCFMPMETNVKKPSTIIAAAFAGLNEVLIEWLQSKQPKVDHGWYDITPLMAACCSNNSSAPECVGLLLNGGADQNRGIRLGLYALIANLGNHLTFQNPSLTKSTISWPKVSTSGKMSCDYTISKVEWQSQISNDAQKAKTTLPFYQQEHPHHHTILRIPRIVYGTQECLYLEKYAKQQKQTHFLTNFKTISSLNMHAQVLPLDIACSKYNWSIALLLLKQSTSIVKHSCFCLLVHQHVGMNAVLLKYNANIQQRTETGCTLLHLAARHGNIWMVLLALIHGSQVNDQDNVDQFTPLHEALYHGHVECIQILLWMGADPFLMTSQGESAIAMAHSLYGKEEGTWIEVVLQQREVVMQYEVFKCYFGIYLFI